MSDLMRLIPYGQLLDWVLTEFKEKGSIFGVSKVVRKDGEKFPIFEGGIETVFGPAAGPNTQLSQNIIASYAAGARWFELKTVQKMDGRELASCVPKPCIASGDECYNCEWSTELEVGQAYEEYVKAWFINHILAQEFGFGDPDGFAFNMSVGYDLEGIQTPKIQKFLDEMKEAKDTDIFKSCVALSLKAAEDGKFRNVTKADILAIPSVISCSVTESTLHGCPPDEIERIARYLLTEKHLNTYIKCNPTLLGYEYARKRLNDLGYDYISFDDHHFLEDLQWKDAVPMFHRLEALAEELNLSFGIKLSNTFPVDVKAGELPSAEMYMAGRALFPLTIELVRRVAVEFDGKLRISYSGGADRHNIHLLVDAGVWPVTMATTILKPGGYQRMSQIDEILSDVKPAPWTGISLPKTGELTALAGYDPYYRKPIKPLPNRKMDVSLPLMDCFEAPCRDGCPIHQDVPAYLRAMEEGRSRDAFEIILMRNALPFITGTICPHTCADKCMRNYYEEGLHIREVKLETAEKAYLPYMAQEESRKPEGRDSDRKVAIVGGGPAGLAAASFLSRAGVPVTVFEKRDTLGGVVRAAIPSFRIANETIEKDIALCGRYGAKFETGHEITNLEELKKEGFTDIIVAVGAWKSGRSPLTYGEAMDALDFLSAIKQKENLDLGEEVVVIGGGNTAMDAARAAVRQMGVKNVHLIYRRTAKYMPADEEELRMALEDGVDFQELLSPIGVRDGKLECSVMKLGDPDQSGRRSPVDTGERRFVPANTVIAAVGERIDTSLYERAGVKLDEKKHPVVDGNNETSVDGIYAIGDGRSGPGTVVRAIADAQAAAASIAQISFENYREENAGGELRNFRAKKGELTETLEVQPDSRCLGCAAICEVCADVCPNRANISIKVPGLQKAQILHVDGMCNECGNCAVFCPYNGRPYRDKLTLFWTAEDFEHSENAGFLPISGTKVLLRFAGKTEEVDLSDEQAGLYDPLRRFILAVLSDYSYLLKR